MNRHTNGNISSRHELSKNISETIMKMSKISPVCTRHGRHLQSISIHPFQSLFPKKHPNCAVLIVDMGLPWWLSGKEPSCQCRRRGFDPWAGKILWRKKWQPIPVLLPGISHRQRSLVGYGRGVIEELEMT